MNKLLLTLIMAVTMNGATAQDLDVADAPKAIPVAVAKLSKEDLKKYVEGIQRLAKEQQIELDNAKRENDSIKEELGEAKQSHREALTSAQVLQQEVNVLTNDRNNLAIAKEKAEAEKDYWHKKHEEAVSKLWWWRVTSTSVAVLLVGALGFYAYTRFSVGSLLK
jgi:hypothetical protein